MHRLGAIAVAILFVATAVAVPAVDAGAAPTTFHVTTGECSGPGSILEAVGLANANPGADTIVVDVPKVHLFQPISPGYTCASPTGDAPFVLKITESVTIDGQGAEFSADPLFANPNGDINAVQAGRCPAESNDLMLAAPVSFVEIGTAGQDNSAIEVTLEHLAVTKMSRLVQVNDQASLTIDAMNVESINNLSHRCEDAAIRVGTGANLTITNSWFNDSVMAAPDFASNAFIFGSGAGDLTIRNSLFSNLRNVQSVRWSAPSTAAVAIVSSQFQGSGGLTIGGHDGSVLDAYLTNSIVRLGSTFIPADLDSSDVIVAGGYSGRAALHVQSSTILVGATECHLGEQAGQCLRPAAGMIVAHQSSSIDFTHSAIGVGKPTSSDNNLALFAVTSGGTITGDEYTWAQPTNLQDAAAINTLIGATVITAVPGLYAGGFYPGDAALTPLFEFGGIPGVLIDAIPDARGVAPIGANVLRDPVTNDPIGTDVWGNPRWDGSDASNIGAIQTTLAPHLVVSAVGDGTVDLTWSQVDPVNPAYPVDSFVVEYRPVGSPDPYTTVVIADPQQCFTTITGLTDGTLYEFVVHAHAPAPVGDQPDSNVVTATPLGPVGSPGPAAQGGDREITLFWTDPPTGGHPGPLTYSVLYRPAGTTDWFAGPGSLSGRVTVLPGLEPGTDYELAVFAVAADGTPSDRVGTTTATTDPGPDDGGSGSGGSGGGDPTFTG